MSALKTIAKNHKTLHEIYFFFIKIYIYFIKMLWAINFFLLFFNSSIYIYVCTYECIHYKNEYMKSLCYMPKLFAIAVLSI